MTMNNENKTISPLQQIENQAYINLETYRKNGEGVKTPVWFVQDGHTIYVRTGEDSWKVKRLQSNPQASIVPSTSTGSPLGDWVAATAELIMDDAKAQEVNKLFNNKYGLQKRLFDLVGRVRGYKLATLAIDLTGNDYRDMKLTINNEEKTVTYKPATPLLWVLRDELELTGTKFRCGVGICGACTVHIDGQATRSCITPLSAVEGKEVCTIEGLATIDVDANNSLVLHVVQQAFIEEQVRSAAGV
jgi:PPOX class probable F420-dependent enzyme